MNPHRQHTFDIPPARPAEPTPPPTNGAVFVVHVTIVCLAIMAGASGLALLLTRDRAQTQPVRQGLVEVYPIEPLTPEAVADARVQAFRAGYRQAVDQGCTTPVALALPIERP